MSTKLNVMPTENHAFFYDAFSLNFPIKHFHGDRQVRKMQINQI